MASDYPLTGAGVVGGPVGDLVVIAGTHPGPFAVANGGADRYASFGERPGASTIIEGFPAPFPGTIVGVSFKASSDSVMVANGQTAYIEIGKINAGAAPLNANVVAVETFPGSGTTRAAILTPAQINGFGTPTASNLNLSIPVAANDRIIARLVNTPGGGSIAPVDSDWSSVIIFQIGDVPL